MSSVGPPSNDAGPTRPRDRGRNRVVLWGVAAIGMGVRLWQWSLGTSLWLDEAFLANSVAERDLLTLLREPLDRAQSVPPAFLALVDLTTTVFGTTTRVLEITPLLAGLATPVLGVLVARRMFGSLAAQLTVVGLCSLSPSLLYYATELKPYGTDVTVTLVGLALLAHHDGSDRALRRLLLFGLVAPWFSLPGALITSAVAAALTVTAAPNRRRAHVRTSIGVGAVGLVAGIRSLNLAPSTPNLATNWRGGFVPSIDELPGWLVDAVAGSVHLAVRHVGVAGSTTDPAWRSLPTLVLTVCALAGVAGLRRHRAVLVFGTLVAVALFVGAAAEVYPLRGRLVLFATPLVIVSLAGAVDALVRRTPPARTPTSGSTAAGSTTSGYTAAGYTAAGAILLAVVVALPGHPPERGDVEAALRHIVAEAEPGDVVVPSAWSEPAFDFTRRGVADVPHVPPDPGGAGAAELVIPADQSLVSFDRAVLPHVDGRVWLLFTHRLEQARPLVAALAECAELVDRHEDRDLGLYLFDFADDAC